MLPNFGDLGTSQLQSNLFCKTQKEAIPSAPPTPVPELVSRRPAPLFIVLLGPKAVSQQVFASPTLSPGSAHLQAWHCQCFTLASSVSQPGHAARSLQPVVEGAHLWGPGSKAARPRGLVMFPTCTSVRCSQIERMGAIWGPCCMEQSHRIPGKAHILCAGLSLHELAPHWAREGNAKGLRLRP